LATQYLFPTDPNRGTRSGPDAVAKPSGPTIPEDEHRRLPAVQSGLGARGFDFVNGVTFLLDRPVQAPFWTNFDLQVTQDIPIGPTNLAIGGIVSNLFNSQPATTVNQNWCASNSNCNTLAAINNPPTNPNFGRATTYAPARKFQLTADITY
jgi:hypothetical protein